MRTIRVAPRQDWVVNQPQMQRRRWSQRLADLAATLPIVLLVPALALPILAAQGRTASLDVAPGSVSPGGTLTVTGAGLARNQALVLVLDDTPFGSVMTRANGRFSAQVAITTNAEIGQHTVRAVADGQSVVAAGVEVIAPNPGAPAIVVPDAGVSAPPPPPPTASPAPASASPTAATPPPAPSASPTPTLTSAPVASASAAPTASPSSSVAVPSPTPSASAAASAAPSPSPVPSADPWSVPMGSRPASGPRSYHGGASGTGCPSVIENLTFRDLGPNVVAIRLENCTNVTIRAVDFINVAEGVYALNSSNITVVDSRYRNILGPYERVGLNRGNFVQFNGVVGGLIDHNKGRCGDTEDIVSLFRTSRVIVEDNHFEGGDGTAGCLAWRSTSGSGIALGDNGGVGNVARRNVLVDPGQVGIFIAGGTDHQMSDNIVYGSQRAGSNVGMYVWNQSAGSCSGHVVANNRVRWVRADGVVNGFWNAGNCGSLAGSGNTWNDGTLDASRYRVSL